MEPTFQSGSQVIKSTKKVGGKKKSKKILKEVEDEYEEIETVVQTITKKKKKKRPANVSIRNLKKNRFLFEFLSQEIEYEEYEETEESAEEYQTPGVYSMYMTYTEMSPKPSVCMTWNGNKIKTFDGLTYRFFRNSILFNIGLFHLYFQT